MNRNDGAVGDARKRDVSMSLSNGQARESARQEAGDVEALAELVSWATGEFTRWSADAHPDHNRWSWRGDGHGLPSEDNPIREYPRDIARTLLASDWLARVIADAKAEAWDEGYDDRHTRGPAADIARANPYREAAR